MLRACVREAFQNNLMTSPVMFDPAAQAVVAGNHRMIAAENRWTYDQWYEMEHNFNNFRPELPSSNMSKRYNRW